MARARNIKPGFFCNDQLVELPFEVRLLFIGLWTIADREGRILDRPKKIKMELFPADNVDCDAGLRLLANAGFLLRYEVDGLKCLQVLNWARHQKPHIKEAQSTIPEYHKQAPEKPVQAPTFTGQAPTFTGQAPEIPERAGLIVGCGLLLEDSLSLDCENKHPCRDEPDVLQAATEKLVSLSQSRFEEFWQTYPATDRRTGKVKCAERWKNRKLDRIADQIIEHVRAMRLTEKWQSGYEPSTLTYINQSQWEDGVPESRRPQARASQHRETQAEKRSRCAAEMFSTIRGGAYERDIIDIN